MTHSSKPKPNYDARIKKLERKQSQLEAEIRRVHEELDPNRWAKQISFESKPKRGCKPRIPPFVLRERDDLIDMLESYWPEILPTCSPLTPNDLHRVLEAITTRGQKRQTEAAQHLLQNFDVLIGFLQSDRYRGEPRHIAYALAGVPHVSWWRSLKYCGKREHRPMIPRGHRAIRDYLKRKQPEVYKCLLKADGDVLKIAVALKKMRSQDTTVQLLQVNARHAAEIWHMGVCDPARLHGRT